MSEPDWEAETDFPGERRDREFGARMRREELSAAERADPTTAVKIDFGKVARRVLGLPAEAPAHEPTDNELKMAEFSKVWEEDNSAFAKSRRSSASMSDFNKLWEGLNMRPFEDLWERWR